MTIQTFLSENNDACHDGRAWLEQQTSLDSAWETCQMSKWMLWALGRTHAGKYEKELRLFACWCARQCKQTDERCVAAIEVAERYAHGKATLDELDKARAAAYVSWAAEGASWAAAAACAAADRSERVACAAEGAAAGKSATYATLSCQSAKLRELIENPYTKLT